MAVQVQSVEDGVERHVLVFALTTILILRRLAI